MKYQVRLFVVGASLLFHLSMAQAEITFLPDPVGATASSSFSGDVASWGPQRLYDTTPTPADLDTNFEAGTALQYAGNGVGPHVLVFDYGESITFNGLAYSQRVTNDPIVDKVQTIEIWVSDTDPGAATLTLPDSLGAADATSGPLETAAGPSPLVLYEFGSELSGQYVIFRLNDAGPGSFNPGGSELQLSFNTNPIDPRIAAPPSLDFGQLAASSPTVNQEFEINNRGAAQTLVISGVTFEGPDAASFEIVSSPASLAPGMAGSVVVAFTPGTESGPVEATAVIASNDSESPTRNVSMTATLLEAIPDDLTILADPLAVTASSFFDPNFAPEFLFDADPTVEDIENPAFDPFSQYAGSGEGPHVLVFDYGETIDFNGLVYAQRLGGIVDADKVPAIEIWTSDSDPGPAGFNLDILSDPVEATVDLVTTDTSPLLRYYALEDDLSGRYIVMRLAQGTFNPGGSELQLTRAGSPVPLQILSIDYPDLSITWNSRPGKTYRVERSANLQGEWEELANSVPSAGELTSFQDATLPPDSLQMFYRVVEN
jgi:hypothetical protein